MKKKIAILGSTGSIGVSTVSLIEKNIKDFNIELISTNKNIKLVEKELTIEFREPFLPRRGRINCSVNDNGKWRWFGTQFIIR